MAARSILKVRGHFLTPFSKAWQRIGSWRCGPPGRKHKARLGARHQFPQQKVSASGVVHGEMVSPAPQRVSGGSIPSRAFLDNRQTTLAGRGVCAVAGTLRPRRGFSFSFCPERRLLNGKAESLRKGRPHP